MRGLEVNDQGCMISMFADSLAVLTVNPKLAFTELIRNICEYRVIAGLQLSKIWNIIYKY